MLHNSSEIVLDTSRILRIISHIERTSLGKGALQGRGF